jgi:hypothetical protein
MNLDAPIRRLQQIELHGMLLLLLTALLFAAGAAASYHLMLLADQGRLGAANALADVLAASSVLCAAAAAVAAAAIALGGSWVSLALRLVVMPAVRRIRLTRLTPVALLTLTGTLNHCDEQAQPTAQGCRLALDHLESWEKDELHRAAKQRAERLGLPAERLNLVRDHLDYDGPVSDIFPLVMLPFQERGQVELTVRSVRRALRDSGRGDPGPLVREVVLPLLAAPANRRILIGRSLRHIVEGGGGDDLQDGLAARLVELLSGFDPQQELMLTLMGRTWDGDHEDLIRAVSTL